MPAEVRNEKKTNKDKHGPKIRQSFWIMLVTLFRPLHKHYHLHHPHQSRLSASISIFLTSENGPMCKKCEMCIRQNLKFKYFFIKTSMTEQTPQILLRLSFEAQTIWPTASSEDLITLSISKVFVFVVVEWLVAIISWFPFLCVSLSILYIYIQAYIHILHPVDS